MLIYSVNHYISLLSARKEYGICESYITQFGFINCIGYLATDDMRMIMNGDFGRLLNGE
jgi:hypothetical protein